MAVIGGILIVAALVVGGFCLWAGSLQPTMATQVAVFDNAVVSITPVAMFVLGALSMLLLLLGIWMAFFATRRRYHSHRERRMLEKREKEQAAELAETRARLAERDREAAPVAGEPQGAADATSALATGSAPEANRRDVPPPSPERSSSSAAATAPERAGEPAPQREELGRAAGESRGSSAVPERPARGPREDGTFDSGR